MLCGFANGRWRERLPTTGPRSGRVGILPIRSLGDDLDQRRRAVGPRERVFSRAQRLHLAKRAFRVSAGRRQAFLPEQLAGPQVHPSDGPALGPNEARDVGAVHVHVDPKSQHLVFRQRLGKAACADDVGPWRPKQRNGNAHDQRENGDHARNDGDSAQRDDPPSELVAAFGSSGGGRFQFGHRTAPLSLWERGQRPPDYFNSPSCFSTTFAGSGP